MFRYGIPLVLGSVGTMFVCAMFTDETSTSENPESIANGDVSSEFNPDSMGSSSTVNPNINVQGANSQVNPNINVQGARSDVSPNINVDSGEFKVNPNINIAGPKIEMPGQSQSPFQIFFNSPSPSGPVSSPDADNKPRVPLLIEDGKVKPEDKAPANNPFTSIMNPPNDTVPASNSLMFPPVPTHKPIIPPMEPPSDFGMQTTSSNATSGTQTTNDSVTQSTSGTQTNDSVTQSIPGTQSLRNARMQPPSNNIPNLPAGMHPSSNNIPNLPAGMPCIGPQCNQVPSDSPFTECQNNNAGTGDPFVDCNSSQGNSQATIPASNQQGPEPLVEGPEEEHYPEEDYEESDGPIVEGPEQDDSVMQDMEESDGPIVEGPEQDGSVMENMEEMEQDAPIIEEASTQDQQSFIEPPIPNTSPQTTPIVEERPVRRRNISEYNNSNYSYRYIGNQRMAIPRNGYTVV